MAAQRMSKMARANVSAQEAGREQTAEVSVILFYSSSPNSER